MTTGDLTSMARHDRTDRSTQRNTNNQVPPPQDTYTEPEKESRSAATQAAVDRWLTWPDVDTDRTGGAR